MKGFFRKVKRSFRYGEKGFTLIELLIVVAILGVLAAIAVPQMTAFLGRGETEARNTELRMVQAAMTAIMVDGGTTTVTAVTTATNDLSGLPNWTGEVEGTDTDFDDLLITTDTAYSYTWIADGTVTQAP